MSDDRVFVDTNVLVYAYDIEAGAKHETARSVLLELWETRSGAMSTQILQEFYVTVTRMLPRPLAKHAALGVLDTYRAWPVHRPGLDDVLAASELEARHQLSFWDALVVVSAERSGAATLLSEDLQAGRRFGQVVIHNPFGAPQLDN